MRIGIDLMGSDHPPQVLFQAILSASAIFPSITFVSFLTKEAFDTFPFEKNKNINFHLVSDFIEMQDDPLTTIREKKDSTLIVGLNCLKEEKLDAFLSAGNTGALVAASAILIPRYKAIKRPPLLAVFSRKNGSTILVDVGGHITYSTKDLIQFAKLGTAYHRAVNEGSKPRLALLNIGTESKKGTKEIQEAYHFLENNAHLMHAHFLGNIEAQDVFSNNYDVIVSDGFTGNILLKTSEGLSDFFLKEIPHLLNSSHCLNQLFNHEQYSGAIVAGLDKLVIKCHGKTSTQGLFFAIKKAIHLVKEEISLKMKQEFS